ELWQVANLLETTAGNTFEAITTLERAHKLFPSDIPILVQLGELYYKSGERNSAYEKLLSAAKLCNAQNQLAEGMNIYRRLIELMPEREEPYLRLGEILEKQGNKNDAVKTYLQLMEQYVVKGRERENIPLMVKILELEPERKELRRELAEKFAAENLLADATYHFTVLGSQYEKEAQWDEAIAVYSRVKELNPENIECREHLADLYLKINAPEKAKQELAQLSEIALARNELAGAEKYFLRIVEIDPNDIAIGERLGKLYEAQGNITAACQEYFRVSERFIELGKADRAIEVLNRIKVLQPQDIMVREKILELWQAQGATTEAAEESLSLCELLFTCGLKEQGVGYCKNIINLVPDSPSLIIKAAKLLLKHNFVD
ncbi:MAG: tetratricopeptide repeat protein, partial [Candidatus Sumerlaeia bacterium]|nr:tetratricopeptide repeat protein [Candidatus Sumerlaeia bacterium]